MKKGEIEEPEEETNETEEENSMDALELLFQESEQDEEYEINDEGEIDDNGNEVAEDQDHDETNNQGSSEPEEAAEATDEPTQQPEQPQGRPNIPYDLALRQYRKPVRGDTISFYDQNTQQWISVVLTSYAAKGGANQPFFNYRTESGDTGWVDTSFDLLWTFPADIPPPEQVRMTQEQQHSLSPTLNNSPPRSESTSGARHKTIPSIRLANHEYLDSDTSDSPPSLLDKTLGSLDWDRFGISLEHPQPKYTDDSDNLDEDSGGVERDLLQVQNLELRLPITSSPITPRRSPRLNPPR